MLRNLFRCAGRNPFLPDRQASQGCQEGIPDSATGIPDSATMLRNLFRCAGRNPFLPDRQASQGCQEGIPDSATMLRNLFRCAGRNPFLPNRQASQGCQEGIPDSATGIPDGATGIPDSATGIPDSAASIECFSTVPNGTLIVRVEPVNRRQHFRFWALLGIGIWASTCSLAADKITVRKMFQGGTESSVRPNQVIANWSITIGGVTTENSIVYIGRTGDNMIEVEFRETEKQAKSEAARTTSTQKIPLYLECDGETICKVEELTIAMRLAGNTLRYTVMADWDTDYVDQKQQLKQCKNSHKWTQKEFYYCPVCGLPLR
jgi:hypothetical protein